MSFETNLGIITFVKSPRAKILSIEAFYETPQNTANLNR